MYATRQTWASCAPTQRWKVTVAGIAVAVGLVVVGLGISASLVLDLVLEEGIRNFLLVDSTSSSGYADWEFNGNKGTSPQNMYYYLWNLTNADQLSTSWGSTDG